MQPTEQPPPVKKPYHPPQLIVYGPVRELTRGGPTGAHLDGGPHAGADGQPTLKVWQGGEASHVVFSEGAEFLIDRLATRVWARWAAPMTLEDAATYLLGPVMGLLLALRGVTCLHGSAVAV